MQFHSTKTKPWLVVGLILLATLAHSVLAETPATAPSVPTQKTPVDPQLAEAWKYYRREKDRDRETAVRLFTDYLAKNPDTPLAAEIYFRIGTLYTSKKLEQDSYEPAIARKYYQSASEKYGSKFSIGSFAVKASLTFTPEKPFEDKIAFYQWLHHLQTHATTQDFWPIQDIPLVAEGYPILVPQEMLEKRVTGYQDVISKFISATESGILTEYGDLDGLQAIMNAVPNTHLGETAKQRLNAAKKEMKSP